MRQPEKMLNQTALVRRAFVGWHCLQLLQSLALFKWTPSAPHEARCGSRNFLVPNCCPPCYLACGGSLAPVQALCKPSASFCPSPGCAFCAATDLPASAAPINTFETASYPMRRLCAATPLDLAN